MITRSKLVDQLRGYQIRSQNKCPALILFSPKPHITSWHYWLSIMAIWLGILLPIRLRSCRQKLVKKRERKFLLPLSM
ncbi:hypothetical protein ERO13_D12G065100v2 [Gossypium hirsutum]|uniref:Uncharacterized protein n=5 Tax=Gossypium TaxID=3633 RepID=A0A0D2SW11_GOSRA|nr:hypothetical protein ES319_D12G069900v1 [Gossypium barbadense]KAG4114756.1 hypothetical protein ERO13_D12G065100v2 [Gossypium hirsutum]KJB48364.1 hypothetical protein B456_008G068300 [Gossypium raimondii]TYG40183.1 hypothetical protein ES288_D12G072800v1 [Gossypium darwinii]TYH37912.1 hypothetical protein ES332_D12G073700v1 [Gossypium tomentosum]TYI49984.1 hypothetical protein E1A91_D12G070400v1 [Gossypium mustelinum]